MLGRARNRGKKVAVQPSAEPTLDAVNRRVWGDPRAISDYAGLSDYSDPGEEVVIARLAELAQRGPILDVGVGAGRTVPLLLPLTDDYVGVDYTPGMVERCAARFPDKRIELADARSLDGFVDESFAAVYFSASGIDAVDREDRQLILREAFRVLRPGGVFAFSTHNLSHVAVGKPPWSLTVMQEQGLRGSLAHLARLPIMARNHRRLRGFARTGDGWAILNDLAHNYGIVIHYTTLRAACAELAAAGFADVEAYDMVAGRRVTRAPETSHSWWLHLLTLKPDTTRLPEGDASAESALPREHELLDAPVPAV